MKRGEIWWANLGEPAGSEPGFQRPVLIVQSNDFNRSQIQTVIVVAITSNLALAHAPGNVALSKRVTKLPKDSIANISQVLTIDRSFLVKKVSRLPDNLLRSVDIGLKLVFALDA